MNNFQVYSEKLYIIDQKISERRSQNCLGCQEEKSSQKHHTCLNYDYDCIYFNEIVQNLIREGILDPEFYNISFNEYEQYLGIFYLK